MKRVLITGGSRGIGAAIVTKFIEEGYEVKSPIRDELNLLSDSSIENFIAENKNIGFDVIINNAGINDLGLIDEIDDENIFNTLQTNLIAPMKLLRGFVPYMKKQNYGRVVNIASIWAIVSKPGRVTYSASKNGIHGVTNTLAVELGEFNILTNTVCPGFTATELTYKNNSQEDIENICRKIPLHRMAKPEEIAKLVYFLGSDENTYINGQKIAIDGGFTVQ